MNATQRTYQTLLDQIVSRRIPAGEVLEERRLADELDVSRTPLRAAMNRLLGEGMLERLSNGSIVPLGKRGGGDGDGAYSGRAAGRTAHASPGLAECPDA
ncbi:hypothetical protein G6F63_015896 [Rhizopus arrhizus]|nr:hypothetical protein G6F63_015896 [Rhizopus arrhizus]